MCPLSFLPTAEQGREGGSPAAARAGGLRARGWSGCEGKEAGRCGGLIPGRSSARGGPRWPGRDGRWQWAAGGTGPALQSSSAAREWGRRVRRKEVAFCHKTPGFPSIPEKNPPPCVTLV